MFKKHCKIQLKSYLVLFLLILLSPIDLKLISYQENQVSAESLFVPENHELTALINKERIKQDKQFLSENSELNKLAASRIANMAELNYFDHINPNGKTIVDELASINYNTSLIGENLAINYEGEDIINAWLDSKSHRENLFNNEYEDIGIAQGEIVINGAKNKATVLVLGSRRKKLFSYLEAK